MSPAVKHLMLAAVLTVATMGRAEAQNIYVDYYEPQFYVDHLVFYDEAGVPIYYDNNTAYTVPRSYEFHNHLVDHFRANVDNYYRWFEEVGYANLHYRRPVAADYYKPMYYMEYPVFYDDRGMPIYYVDGRMYRVPASYTHYNAMLAYYRAKRAMYRRWYQSRGRYYRWYRRPLYTDYYRPLYHDGYVVFYDDGGRPYYYRDGRTVYIPAGHRRYNVYVSHYRSHRPHYRRWYKSRGRTHHGYRRARVYRTRTVAPRAPRAARGRAMDRRYRHRVRPGPAHRVRPGPAHRVERRHERQERRMDRRHQRQENRVERRHERQERRMDRRHNRQEARRGVDCARNPGHPMCRRHQRQENRVDRRHQRQENRVERRHNRQERRQEQRHNRQERRRRR